MPWFSSQEDGGGHAPHWSSLSQGVPEPPPPLDRSDAVRGDVSDHQHFHLLRRILQQTRGHVRRGGPGLGRDGGTTRGWWSRPWRVSAGSGRCCIGHIHTITYGAEYEEIVLDSLGTNNEV